MFKDETSDFERLLGELSARFLGLPPDQIDGEVTRVLRLTCDWLDTDRAYLLECSPDLSELTLRHIWARPGLTQPPLPKMVHAQFPWYSAELLAGRSIVQHELPRDIPDEAVAERAFVVSIGARASVAVPIAVAGHNLCALGTTSFTRPRTWSARDVERVRLIGGVLASAIHRQRTDCELQARLTEIHALQERLAVENVYLREEIRTTRGFQEIVGESPTLKRVLAQAALVAPTPAPVLLLGETGTGKELLAHAIHDRSQRRHHPLVKVNCAAIPPALVESELFGHEKGAFTGAVSARTGRFEIAHGGTLFLDEIGDIDLDLQVKLLRVLQDGEFERVGSSRTLKADARIIAATNCDLSQAIEGGQFRNDLYYRLSVFPIQVPPLRARREDIPMLVWGFINRRQVELRRYITKIRHADMQALVAYDWPGNIRELQNVIERALILSTGETLRLEGFLPETARSDVRSVRLQTLNDVERGHIVAVLDRCGWIIDGPGHAAEVLGLHPNTLRFRMNKLGIHRPVPSTRVLLVR